MKVVDVDNERCVRKRNVIEFFSLPNFLNVVTVEKPEEPFVVV